MSTTPLALDVIADMISSVFVDETDEVDVVVVETEDDVESSLSLLLPSLSEGRVVTVDED